jgi:hypothetical protein
MQQWWKKIGVPSSLDYTKTRVTYVSLSIHNKAVIQEIGILFFSKTGL